MDESSVVIALIGAGAVVVSTLVNAVASIFTAKRSKAAQDQSAIAASASVSASQNAAAAVENTNPISNGWSNDVQAKLSDIATTLHEHVSDKTLHHHHRQTDEIIRGR